MLFIRIDIINSKIRGTQKVSNMMINDGYILRNIAGVHVVVPVGERVIDFNGMITLNDTGAFLWKAIDMDVSIEDLPELLTKEYEVSIEDAKKDVFEFVDILKENNIIKA